MDEGLCQSEFEELIETLSSYDLECLSESIRDPPELNEKMKIALKIYQEGKDE